MKVLYEINEKRYQIRELCLFKSVIANRVTNISFHSLSQIFKGGTEVRVDVPAPHHNVIPEKITQYYL